MSRIYIGTSRTSVASRMTVPMQQNLIHFSEDFTEGVDWDCGGSGSILTNIAIAPDGNFTADGLVDTMVNDYHYVFQNSPLQDGLVIKTNSVFAKAGSQPWLSIWVNDGVSLAYFDLIHGVTGSFDDSESVIISSSINNLGNGWFRCSVTYMNTTASSTILFNPAMMDGGVVYMGTGTVSTYLWGAQMIHGNWAGNYTKTTSSVVNNGQIRNISPNRMTA